LGRHSLAGNVFGLGEVAEIEAQMFSFAQKFNRTTALEPTTKLSYEALHSTLRQTAVTG
jgi:hypothetical protein